MKKSKAENVTLAFALLFFFIFLNNPVSALTDYTASTATTCNDGICTKTLYSGTYFQQDEFSMFQPMTDVTKVVYDMGNGKLKIKWNDSDSLDNEIDLETLISFGGELFKPIDAECSDMNYTIDIHDKDYNYKYDIAFNLPANDTSILLDINTDFNYSIFETYLFIDKFRFGFEDAIAENYTVNISTYLKNDKEIIRINFTKGWDFYNISVGDYVVIDPTVQLRDADTENLGDTYVDPNNKDTNYGSEISLYVGYSDSSDCGFPTKFCQRAYLQFNTTTMQSINEFFNVSLCFNDGDGGENNKIHHVYNWTSSIDGSSLTEDNMTWNNQPCGDGTNDIAIDNSTNCNLTEIAYGGEKTIGDYECADLTDFFNGLASIESSESFMVANKVLHSSDTVSLYSRSKEYINDNYKPYLTFTYYDTVPVVQSTTILPATLYADSTLNCSANYFSSVVNGSLEFQWYKNDVLDNALNGSEVNLTGSVTGYTNATVGTLTKDDVWICSARAWNTTDYSSWLNSSPNTVLNSLPVIGIPTLNDSTPETDDSLLCTNGTVTDADGDTITWYYSWYETNVLGPGGFEDVIIAGEILNILSLIISDLDKSDTVICSTIASDGTDNATAWKNTTEATIQNSVPITTTPTLSESSIYKNISALTCNNASVTDIDDDNITWHYLWHLDNVTNVTTQNITNSTYSEGDQLICEIWADDGEANSTHYNSTTLTVLNSQPTVLDITITPAPAESTDDLNSSYTYYDVDGDAEVTQYYFWYVDDIMVSTSQNLSSGNLSGSDDVILSIIVNDGTDNSTATNSSILTVGDSTVPVLHTQSMSSIINNINTAFTVGINVTEANDIAWVYVEVTNPALASINFTMSLSSGAAPEHYYTKSYTPTTVGLYTFKFYSQDGSGNLGYYAGTQEFTATAAESPSAGGGSTFSITQEALCGDGVCSGDETSESCPIDCLPDFFMSPEKTEVTVGFDGKKTGRIKIINNGVRDKTITVTVTPADYLYINGDENKEYVRVYEIGRKVGLQSGEAYVEWEVDLTDTNLSLGDYEYILTFDDGFNIVRYDFTMTVGEPGFSPEIVIGTILGGLLLVTVAPPFVRKYKRGKKKR